MDEDPVTRDGIHLASTARVLDTLLHGSLNSEFETLMEQVCLPWQNC